MMQVGGITWTDDDMLAEIERLTAENRRYEKYIDIQANEILEHEQTIATLTAELEAALHGTVTTKYHDDLMHQWHVKVVDLEAEVERLSAELEHHKGKAEVWEDAARAAQAKVEALEADRDKRVDKWMQLIVGKDERIERLEVVAIHAQAKIKALEGVVDAVMAYDSNLIDTLTRARITMPQSSRVSE